MPIPGLNEPFPSRDEIVKASRKGADVFVRWIEQGLLARLSASPVLAEPPVVLTDKNTTQADTIGGTQSAGFYQVNAYLECTTADGGGAPTAQLTLTWTHNGKVLTRTYTALSGSNVANTRGEVDVIQIDGGTPVDYTIVYTAGATPLLFKFSATLSLTLVASIED
jgi:hypothetical protein